jgi:hypothetical protein
VAGARGQVAMCTGLWLLSWRIMALREEQSWNWKSQKLVSG